MATERPVRNYKCSDRTLISGGLVLVENFKAHKAAFEEVRGDMEGTFAEDLKTRLDKAADLNLGDTSNEGTLDGTTPLAQAKELAKEKVALMKNTVEARFGSDPAAQKKHLADLGLDKHYAKFYAGDDESALELYTKMKLALSGATKTELVAAGIKGTLLDNALAALLPLSNLNTTQEGEKGADKTLTDANILEFNAIHAILMDICSQGQTLFAKNAAVKDKFVWGTVTRGM